jgi:hypothetical protein
MPRFKSGGRLTTSPTPPSLFSQKRSASTETKYFGLRRDDALSDITDVGAALNEVLTDIQDPAEASTLGKFTSSDLQILDGAVRFDQKREDFEILLNSSINAEDEQGRLVPLINPRQRISDRIKQFEGFAGRGTVYQGQGTVLFKYYVPPTEPTNSANKYSHTNPPPFYTEAIGSSAENAPDFIPVTSEEIARTHRLGYIQDGVFVPSQEPEWWWNGEYNQEWKDSDAYGNEGQSALTNPRFPIVRDGNIVFQSIIPEGINTRYNWGLRFDAWFKRDFVSADNFAKFVTQVHGHIRIDYFDRTGYDSSGTVQGTWRTALDTTNSSTFYSHNTKENPTSTPAGSRIYYLQGGPATPLGGGDGTLPTQRATTNGGALDLSATYTDREGNSRSKFDNEYVPVVIRFWYGQPSTDPTQTNPLTRAPFEPAGFCLETASSSVSAGNLGLWNDYSSQIKLEYVAAQGAWKIDTSVGGSPLSEDNFSNYMENFEIVAHGQVGANPTKPAQLTAYNYPDVLIVASKQLEVGGVIHATISIPGISPSDGQKIWVVGRNRPRVTAPGTASLGIESLWQNYLFYPSPEGLYLNSDDLLEGIGINYSEPEPSKKIFEENTTYYQSKFGELSLVGEYGQARYDGTLRNSLTDAIGQRDYDYSHEKLLFIGRQKKDSSIQSLVPDEVRPNGGNYTFIEVTENQAGFGGSIIINAYPTNNMGVLSTTVNDAQLGKFLHMADNTKTFNSTARQSITIADPVPLPSITDFASTARLLYEEINGQGRFSYGTWNGSAFTYDATGIIASLTMGSGGVRNHLTKAGFISDFTKPGGGGTFSFFGLIGVSRESLANVSVTVAAGGTTIVSGDIFSNNGETSNNNQYIGTEVVFPGDATVRRVTSYNASTQTVTFTPSKTEGTYAGTEVWYNYFTVGGVLPGVVVNSSGTRISRTAQIPAPTGGNTSSRLIQVNLAFNSAHQFSRTDNGAGLSFGEILYAQQKSSGASASSPFTSDTELPAPPAGIVVPFGYDNTPSAGDPGLGGLCYPPYSIQDIELQGIATNDAGLYASTEGNFDIWWGGRNVSLADLGQKSLTITDRLLFDFDNAQRSNILSTLSAGNKPSFTGSEYTHKLAVDLNVGLPTPPVDNSNLYNDVRLHSNNKPVKDKYSLFINLGANNQLEVLTVNNPGWT